MIMLILFTFSSMVMAEDKQIVIITPNPENNIVGEKSTTLTEEVGNYFVWSIPNNLPVTGANDTITVKVNQAHLNQYRSLKISIEGLEEDGKVQLKYGDILGSKISFKKGEIALNSNESEILVVTSREFDSNNNSNIPSVDISLVVERNPFQYTNTYTGQITFKATIS